MFLLRLMTGSVEEFISEKQQRFWWGGKDILAKNYTTWLREC